MVENSELRQFPVLETERLRLRQLGPLDAAALFRILSSEEVTRYYGRFPLIEQLEAEEMIERFRLLFEEQRGFRWGIELKENAQVIGTVGFHAWAYSHNRAEIGYELNESYHGKGYAHEALTAAISYGYQDMGLNRIEALVYPQNEASERLLLRLGFQLEGLLKQYAFFRDTYVDLNMFALLREP
ncbi:GNAT family N-acetyltransferase [Paenibacillus segetis]|uniref:N-acetyltransferase YoaA n=1 Tax=Paenibacillus segetis TaxID=1325360 RepID=A0ABQ1YN75_9BACL|nr:GNAT family N-acetyltransferase [Paenibacillus segetis]GGH30886.1 putative N-acetyltransferase YoaA [Paenibacillus segetis]